MFKISKVLELHLVQSLEFQKFAGIHFITVVFTVDFNEL